MQRQLFFCCLPDEKICGTSKCSIIGNRHAGLCLGSISATEDIDSKPVREVIEQKYEKLLEWLKSTDGIYINEKITIRPSSRGGGFGAFVVSDVVNDEQIERDNSLPVIEQDEILLTIPRSACITLNDALNDEDCGEGFRALREQAGPGANTVVIAGYMAAEWLKCIENSNDINESRFGPYLATLPWSRGINNQEHILYWDDDEIESTLKGSLCYGEAVDLHQEMKVANKVVNTIIGRALLDKEEETGFRLPWQKKEKTPVGEVKGLKNVLTGAFVSVLTRSFEDDFGGDDDQEKLVPLLDMMQHSERPNVSHFMRKTDGAVEVRAKIPMNYDDELVNQY